MLKLTDDVVEFEGWVPFFVWYDFFEDEDFDIVEGEFQLLEGDLKPLYKISPNVEMRKAVSL